VSWKGHGAIGAGAILVGLALVPLIWECDAGISGWNVLIFVLIAVGASQFGAAFGRVTRQRLVGIGATVIAVLGALVLIGVINEGRC
jgi:hypothetical protein